ncbi:MAG: CopG family transcriptional regulator [Caldilineaceae bacterium]|nr:CopG family transcriptional regulator [Caldilineaceae bacterium]
MKTKTVTLDITQTVLRELEQIAAERHVPVTKLITDALEDLIMHERRYKDAKQRQLALIRQGLNLGTDGRSATSRDELHERD